MKHTSKPAKLLRDKISSKGYKLIGGISPTFDQLPTVFLVQTLE